VPEPCGTGARSRLGRSHRNGDDEINEVTRRRGVRPVNNRWRNGWRAGVRRRRGSSTDAVWTGHAPGRVAVAIRGRRESGEALRRRGEYDPVGDRWSPLTWGTAVRTGDAHAIWTGRGMNDLGDRPGGSRVLRCRLWEPAPEDQELLVVFPACPACGGGSRTCPGMGPGHRVNHHRRFACVPTAGRRTWWR